MCLPLSRVGKLNGSGAGEMLRGGRAGRNLIREVVVKKIAEQVAEGRTLVSDGGWGTSLQKRGLTTSECPELWCLERREDVLGVARGYVEAGADMIQTNSFGGSSLKLERFGLGDRAREINEAAARISREAAGPDRHVIASVGPSGVILMMGEVSEEKLYESFAEQIKALEAGGADAVCIETMSALDEALCAIRAAKENTDLEIISTFTFEKTVQGEYRTMMGLSPAEAAPAVVDAGASVIGSNCGNGMENMVEIVARMRTVCPDTPILVHANAGMPQQRDGEVVYPETPAVTASFVPRLIEAGANIIGGCCGTTSEHVAALAKAVAAS